MTRSNKTAQSANMADLPTEEIAALAKTEAADLTKWHQDGQNGPRPATPASDWIAANPRASRASHKVGTSRGVIPPDGFLAFYIGNPGEETATRLVAETQHAWSYMAGYTRGGPEGTLTTRDVIGRLRDMGVTDPDHQPARIVLPCPKGPRVVETRLIPGRVLPNGDVVGDDGIARPIKPARKPAAGKPATPRKRAPRKPAAGKPAA